MGALFGAVVVACGGYLAWDWRETRTQAAEREPPHAAIPAAPAAAPRPFGPRAPFGPPRPAAPPALADAPTETQAPVETLLTPVPAPIDQPAPAGIPAGFVSDEVFGRTLHGVRPEVMERLQRVAATLDDPGVFSISGFRSGSRGHSAGLAVDINYYRNPYVMNEAGEDDLDGRLAPVYHRVSLLMLGRPSVVPDGLKEGAPGEERTMRLYDQLREESDAMIRYFRLMGSAEALRDLLAERAERVQPPYFQAEHRLPSALQRLMMRDYVTLSGREGPPVAGLSYPAAEQGLSGDPPFQGDPAYRGPEFGFLDLKRELVQGLTRAGFRWGGVDFGRSSGDIMHFHLPAATLHASARR